jgi:hypothetical protein
MGLSHSPSLVMDGLVFSMDAGNSRCYSGSGITVNGLVGGIGGTLVGGVGYANRNNGSFFCTNAADHINFGNPTVLQGLQINMTLSCWFNQTGNRQYATIYSDYSETTSSKLVSLLRVDSGYLRYFTTTSGGGHQNINPITVVNGVWYYAAISVSGTISSPVANFFVNGTNYSFSLGSMSSTPFLGNNHCVGGNFHIAECFDGNISQVQIYNRALSAQEIKQNYNATKKRYGL